MRGTDILYEPSYVGPFGCIHEQMGTRGTGVGGVDVDAERKMGSEQRS